MRVLYLYMSTSDHQEITTYALRYIESNLSECTSISKVAEHVGISPFHFQRIFFSEVGEPMASYLRRRRLELAANIIAKHPQSPLIQVAMECGFETHSSFSKAFKQHFEMSPTKFANIGAATILKNNVDSRPFLKSSDKRGIIMEVDYLYLPEMWLQYRQQTGVSDGVFFPNRSEVVKGLNDLQAANNSNLIALCGAYSIGPKGFSDDSAIGSFGGIFTSRPDNSWSDQIEKIDACKWAVFPHYGAFEYLHLTWNKAVRNWIPQNKLSIRNGWMLETYLPLLDKPKPDQASAQILIPLEE